MALLVEGGGRRAAEPDRDVPAALAAFARSRAEPSVDVEEADGGLFGVVSGRLGAMLPRRGGFVMGAVPFFSGDLGTSAEAGAGVGASAGSTGSSPGAIVEIGINSECDAWTVETVKAIT